MVFDKSLFGHFLGGYPPFKRVLPLDFLTFKCVGNFELCISMVKKRY